MIARLCTTGGNLHRLDLPGINEIGFLEQQEELRRLSQQIDFLIPEKKRPVLKRLPHRSTRGSAALASEPMNIACDRDETPCMLHRQKVGFQTRCHPF